MELISFGDNGWGDELFVATLMTIAVAITAMLIGFLFALIFTPLKLSKYKFLNLIANFYTTVVRGVPELLVIYLFFFGGSGAIMYVAQIFGYYDYIEINSFLTGATSIGIISGAYSTVTFEFCFRPEFIEEGMRILLVDGRTKVIGWIKEVF